MKILVILPRLCSSSIHCEFGIADITHAMSSPLRILNLEDNPFDAELNKATIMAQWPDCEIVHAPNREEYLAAIEKGDFDIIISDYSLPGYTGSDALKVAREKCPDVPFLLVSGTIGEDVAVETLKNGATDFVLKNRLGRLVPCMERALNEVEEREERRRAEEAMRQSEHKYRELFECLSDAAFLADEKSAKIIDTNHSAETMLGCNRGEIVGKKLPQFLSLEDTRVWGGATGVDTKAGNVFECDLKCTDGKVVPVEVHVSRLTLYGRNLILRLCRVVK